MAVDEEEQQLRELEEQRRQLEEELEQVREEAQDARRAGDAVLTAAEAVMAPLMAELAEAQRACAANGQLAQAAAADVALTAQDGGGDALPLDTSPEVEVQHLRVDIAACKERVDLLESERRSRLHRIGRLHSEVTEVSEALAYERQRAKHYEACKPTTRSYPNLGKGVGLRTMEVRGEQKLRECADQRMGKLAREVVRLASSLADQQGTVKRLTKELDKVRQRGQGKSKQLEKAAKQTHSLRVQLAHGPQEDGGQSAGQGKRAGLRKGPKVTQSTGKLPSLSF